MFYIGCGGCLKGSQVRDHWRSGGNWGKLPSHNPPAGQMRTDLGLQMALKWTLDGLRVTF